MPAKSARGAKRKCQNEECLVPFYDLGREDFECPVCGTAFDHEAAARAAEPQPSRYPSRKQPRELPIVASEEPEEAAAEDAIPDTEDDDDTETTAAETSDVLLDDEEDDNLANAIEIPATEEKDDT